MSRLEPISEIEDYDPKIGGYDASCKDGYHCANHEVAYHASMAVELRRRLGQDFNFKYGCFFAEEVTAKTTAEDLCKSFALAVSRMGGKMANLSDMKAHLRGVSEDKIGEAIEKLSHARARARWLKQRRAAVS